MGNKGDGDEGNDMSVGHYWGIIWVLAAFIYGSILASCSANAARNTKTECQVTEGYPYLAELCEEHIEGIGVLTIVEVTPDGTPFFGYGEEQYHAYSYVTGGRKPKCNIIVQEHHLDTSEANIAHLIWHESLHCELWISTGDPDRGHCSPLWDFVGEHCEKVSTDL